MSMKTPTPNPPKNHIRYRYELYSYKVYPSKTKMKLNNLLHIYQLSIAKRARGGARGEGEVF